MINHFELSDAEFVQSLSDCSLDPKLFSHEAHLRLAWLQLRNFGLKKAVENISLILSRYVNYIGAGDKYNHTVTIAAIKAVDHFMRRSAASDFKNFILENPGLKFNFRELLGYHYSQNIFTSEIAKREYMEPDLVGFDN